MTVVRASIGRHSDCGEGGKDKGRRERERRQVFEVSANVREGVKGGRDSCETPKLNLVRKDAVDDVERNGEVAHQVLDAITCSTTCARTHTHTHTTFIHDAGLHTSPPSGASNLHVRARVPTRGCVQQLCACLRAAVKVRLASQGDEDVGEEALEHVDADAFVVGGVVLPE